MTMTTKNIRRWATEGFPDLEEAFDEWLSELIRKEREEAWGAGYMQGISDRDAATLEGSYGVVPFADNPHRRG